MITKMKSDKFQLELEYISDNTLRTIVTDFLNIRTPEYFWSVPASSTGKFHPEISLGEGGLVRHTKAVVMIAEEMLDLSMWSALLPIKDEIIASCLIHDTFKLGEPQVKYTIHDHPIVASKKFKEFVKPYNYSESKIDNICGMVASHMGQWNENKHSSVQLPTPQTAGQKFVHLCDFLASRKFIGSVDQ